MPKRDADDRRVLITVLVVTVPVSLILLFMLPNGPVFRVFLQKSDSMAPTLHRRSVILASRASYGFNRYSFDGFRLPLTRRWPSAQPKRGDIVVFRLPRRHDTFFIKRLIGLPGDTIAHSGGNVILNGQPVPREPLALPATMRARFGDARHFRERLPDGRTYGVLDLETNGPFDTVSEIVVPQGHVYVLGDNRDSSLDSRSRSGLGTIPEQYLLGRVVWHLMY